MLITIFMTYVCGKDGSSICTVSAKCIEKTMVVLI